MQSFFADRAVEELVFGRDQITYPAQVHMTVSNQMADRMVRETGWTALGPHTFYTRDEVLESVSACCLFVAFTSRLIKRGAL
jgi:ATP-dependent Zn protease